MFIQNKYTKWYNNIVNKALSLDRKKGDVYYESHHIIPRCLGGDNTKKNLVLLTAKEHFICHWLLTKMVEGNQKYKMYAALGRMSYGQPERRQYSAKQYEIGRKYISEASRMQFLGKPKTAEHRESMRRAYREGRRKIDKIPKFKGRKHSEESKELIRQKRAKQVFTEASKTKRAESMRGQKRTEEQRRHKSDVMKIWWENRRNVRE